MQVDKVPIAGRFARPLPPKVNTGAYEVLICAYALAEDYCRELTLEELEAELARPWQNGQPYIWAHFNLSNAHTISWLEHHCDLPPTFYEAIDEEGRSTRIEREEDNLIAVINDVIFDFDFDADDIATLWMTVTPGLVVSARKKPLRSADRLRMDMKHRAPPSSPIGLLVHLLHDQEDELTDITTTITAEINHIEDWLLADRVGNSRTRLARARRLIVRLRRLLAPEPSALFRLLNDPPDWISEDDLLDFRQSTEEFASVIQDMQSVNERIKILQEEIAAKVNAQMNRSLYVLTIVTVMALPFNVVAGLFGMNVGGIPFANHPGGFWIVIILLAVCLALMIYYFFIHQGDRF